MIVTKSRACDRALKKQLQARENIEKTYLAVTWGVPDAGRRAKLPVRAEHGADMEGTLRVKMKTSDAPGALHAATVFDVVEVAARRIGRLVCSRPVLAGDRPPAPDRLHLAFARRAGRRRQALRPTSWPSRAPRRRADADDVARLELPRHALHAARLSLPHPITGLPLSSKRRPPDIADFWRHLRP